MHTYVALYTCNVLTGRVRLVDGSNSYEGRVEVYHNGEWGKVCDDGWDLNDAQVVCRQLGYASAINARSNAYYGQGSGQIWLDDVDCVGNELRIEDRSHNGWGIENCNYYEIAGIQCSTLDGKYLHITVAVIELCVYDT